MGSTLDGDRQSRTRRIEAHVSAEYEKTRDSKLQGRTGSHCETNRLEVFREHFLALV
jgi:hypothetical protein